jgi:hypothetical protein
MCRSSAEGCRGRAHPRAGPGGWRLIGGPSWDCNSPGSERRAPISGGAARQMFRDKPGPAPVIQSTRGSVSRRPPPSRWHSRSFFWDGACTRGLARVSQGRGSFRGGRPCGVGSLCWFPFFSLPPSWRRARLNPSTRRRPSSRPLHRSNSPSLWRRRRNRLPHHSNTPSRPHRRHSKPLHRSRLPSPRRRPRSKPLHRRQLRQWRSRPPPMRLQLRPRPPRRRRSMPRRQPLFLSSRPQQRRVLLRRRQLRQWLSQPLQLRPRQRRSMPRRQSLFLSSRLPPPRPLLHRKLHRRTRRRLRLRPMHPQLQPPLRWRLLPLLPPLPTS